MNTKKVLELVLVIGCCFSLFSQNNFVEKIKKAKENAENDQHLYEEILEELFNQNYDIWIDTVKKLKKDAELKYRKEGNILQQIINKKLYLSMTLKKLCEGAYEKIKHALKKKIKGYKKELFYLSIYVEKRNLQLLFAINNILKDEKKPLYIVEQVLVEVNNEIKSGRKIEDKFIVNSILYLIDRFYLADKVKWVKPYLNYNDTEIKKEALNLIAKFNYNEAIEEITVCLLDESPEIRSYALEILGDLYAVEKKLFVLKKLEDPSPVVRISAIRAARKLGIVDDKSLKEIIKYLHDKEIDVVVEVLYTIRYLNLYKACEEVLDLIKNIEIPDSKTESEKFEMVARLINEGIITLTYLNYNTKEFRKFLLKKIIGSNEPELIKVALRAIGYLKIKPKGMVQDILQILNNPAHDATLLSSALYALGYLNVKDVIKDYIKNRIENLTYNEIETIQEIAKNIYYPQLINELYKEYNKNVEDNEKLYLRKLHIIQVLSKFAFIKKVKDILIKIALEETDIRLINLIVEELRAFKLTVDDYNKLYEIYKKIENNEMEDIEGYLPIGRENISRLVSRVSKYFHQIFKDYDDLPSITLKKITYLEVIEENPNYVDDTVKKRMVNILYNSKNPENGYDHPSQVYRSVCTIINLGIENVINDSLKEELKKLIERFEGNSKYYDAVSASKLLLLLGGDRTYIDILSDIESIQGFCGISEYLNLLRDKDFLKEFKKIKFGNRILSGPAYKVFNLLNKILAKKTSYTLNYLNIPYDRLNKYVLIEIRRGENLFNLLERIVKEILFGYTYIIHNKTIVIYPPEQATNQWLLWYYKNKQN